MKLFVRFERRVIWRFREIWILSNWYDTRLQFSDMQMNAYQFNQDEILSIFFAEDFKRQKLKTKRLKIALMSETTETDFFPIFL